MNDRPGYGDAEAKQIIERATEIDREQGQRLDARALREIGTEAGIPPSAVERAIEEHESAAHAKEPWLKRHRATSVMRPATFSYRSARSGSVVIGFSAAIVIEMVALHLALVSRHPFMASSLTTLNVLTISWLIRDYVAFGRHVVHVDDETLRLKIGRRLDISVSLSNIARVLRPSFRDLPRSGTNQGRDYLDLTKPASPNVLIILNTVVKVRFPGGFYKMVGRFSLHLDEPDAFLTEVATRQTRIVAPATSRH